MPVATCPPFFVLIISFPPFSFFPFSFLFFSSLKFPSLSSPLLSSCPSQDPRLRFPFWQLTASHLPLSLSPRVSLGARLGHMRPRRALIVFPELRHRLYGIVRLSNVTGRRSPISADQASLSAARALTPFGSIFGSKEIGSKSRGTILCLDCVLQSAVISVVTAVQWAAAVAVGEKASGWVHNHHHHWSRKSSNLPTVLSIPPPKLLPDLKRGQKKGAKSGRYKCGKLAGSGETSVGAPVSRVLPRGAPVGARTGTTLRCFNPPAAANSRAAPVTAKTSRGDGHWSVGGQQLAGADV